MAHASGGVGISVQQHPDIKVEGNKICSSPDPDQATVRVHGGFFWNQDPSPVRISGVVDSMISNCVFMPRPQWWNLRAWYRVWRLLLILPYADVKGGQ